MFGLVKKLVKKKEIINFEINMEYRLQECLLACVAAEGEYESVSDLTSLLANTLGNADVTVVSIGYHDNLEFISTSIPNEDNFISVKEEFNKLYEMNHRSIFTFQKLNFSENLAKREGVEDIECVVLRIGRQAYGFILIEKFEDINTENNSLKSLYALMSVIVRNFTLQQQNKVALYMDSQTLLLGRDSMKARMNSFERDCSSNICIGILHIKNILELHESTNEREVFHEITRLMVNILGVNNVYRIADSEIAFFIYEDHVDTSSILHSLKDSLAGMFVSLKFSIAFADIHGNPKKALHLCETQVLSLEDGDVHYFNEGVEQISVLDDLKNTVQQNEKISEEHILSNQDTYSEEKSDLGKIPISTNVEKKQFQQVSISSAKKNSTTKKKKKHKSPTIISDVDDDVEFSFEFEDFI